MREEAIVFGETGSLVGILTDPSNKEQRASLPGIILLNAGIIHRVGPNRLSVKIARRLAEAGFTAFRFDFSGIGDSPVRYDHLPFDQSAVREARQAMDYLEAKLGLGRFVLTGLCSGAFVALQTACADPRVVGTILMNTEPEPGSLTGDLNTYIETRKNARYYWKFAATTPRSWLKAITGRANYRNIAQTLGYQLKSLFTSKGMVLPEANDAARRYRMMTERGVRLLLIYSANDVGLDYLRTVAGDEIERLRAEGKVDLRIISRTDHIFTLLSNQERLIGTITDWANGFAQKAAINHT